MNPKGRPEGEFVPEARQCEGWSSERAGRRQGTMSEPIFSLWVYLAATPLAGLTLTLVAYLAGFAIYERARFHPLANPVPIAVAIVVAALAATRTDYRTYFDGAQFVHFLLGPAVVGLAVPLAREWPRVRRLALPIAGALAAGSAVAALSAVGIAWALGASVETLASIAPKSVTAPIAMGIAETIGGVPALAAVFAVTTGVIGAVTGKYVLDACRVADWPRAGFRARTRRPRHRHRARVPGLRRGRCVRGPGVRVARAICGARVPAGALARTMGALTIWWRASDSTRNATAVRQCASSSGQRSRPRRRGRRR